jgi:Carboxypeptidase regulatory-like domain
MKARLFQTLLLTIVSFCAGSLLAKSLAAQDAKTGGLRGQVTDPSGATVGGATILLSTPSGASLDTVTTKDGLYEFKNLAPGKYTVKAVADGFAQFKQENVTVSVGQIQRLNIALTIEVQEQKVTVNDSNTTVDVNPANNAGAIVIKDKDLEALSDDPDEFQSELQALAGPSAGPNGGQIYIDGFTAGQLPPKSSIREIRINQNPFSAEYDKLGYGRIEILTKPGTDNWHGQVQVQGTSSAFNSKDPFLGDSLQPDYDSTFYNASIGGPLSKKVSLFFSIDRRNQNNLNVVSATVLDPTDPTVTTPFSQAVPFPQTRTNLGPRFDFQLGPSNTLSVRYQYFRDDQQNEGVGGFNLATQGYNELETEDTLQITDTQILSPRTINETRFQYIHDTTGQNIVAAGLPFTIDNPTVNVQGAFISGPNNLGNQSDVQNSYEVQNFTAITAGSHLIKFGGRLRATHDDTSLTNNFNGQFTFASLAIFQKTIQLLQAGETPAMVLAAGFGARQYSVITGTPSLTNDYVDVEPYVQDDWKFRPNITLSYGLRYEAQNNLGDHHDFAPRLGAAWGVGAKGKKPAIVVLRAGFGIFYDRFTQLLIEQQERLNGVLQTQTTITNPQCFPMANPAGDFGPSTCLTAGGAISTLGTKYQNNPDLRTPYTMQTGVSVERQLTKFANLAVTYLSSRGVHQYVTTNINAPLPCTVAGCDPASQPRPMPAAGDIYQYQSAGIFKQNQLIVNSSVRMGTKLSLFGYYVLNYANADTAGPNTFASNSDDIAQDYGRTPYDIRNRLFLGGTVGLPYAFRLSPFVIASSGIPFNVTTGQDNNNDSIFNDRPAFATGCGAGAPSNLVSTRLGCLNIAPVPGDPLLPYDFGTSPGRFSFNLRLSKSFGFGAKKENANADLGGPRGGTFGRGPGGGGGGRGGGGGGGGFGPGNPTNRRFGLTFSVSAQNLFNNVNVATPVGIVTSPIFGFANGLAGRPYSTNTANRRLDLQVLFSF